MDHCKLLFRGWLLAALCLAWLGCRHADDSDYQIAPLACRPPVMPPSWMPPPGAPLHVAQTPPAASLAPSPSAEKTAQEPVHVTLAPPAPERTEEAAQRPTPEQVAPLRALYRLAADRFAATPGYVARLRRRETVDGKAQPEELLLFKYRKSPPSIWMKWIGDEHKGRELVYVKGQYDNLVHVLPQPDAEGPFHLMSRHHVEQQADTPHGLGRQRWPVAEVGIAPWIERFGRLVEAFAAGDGAVGGLKYQGSVKRPEYDAAVDAVVHAIPPGLESGLPQGGERLWFFDTRLRLPVLVITRDHSGREVEYYCFDRFYFPVQFQESDFNPSNLGRR